MSATKVLARYARSGSSYGAALTRHDIPAHMRGEIATWSNLYINASTLFVDRFDSASEGVLSVTDQNLCNYIWTNRYYFNGVFQSSNEFYYPKLSGIYGLVAGLSFWDSTPLKRVVAGPNGVSSNLTILSAPVDAYDIAQ